MTEEHSEKSLNKHEDHIAICFCCTYCSVTYADDWSDITPGAGFEVNCHKGHFHLSDRFSQPNYHDAITKGMTCEDYSSRSKKGELRNG